MTFVSWSDGVRQITTRAKHPVAIVVLTTMLIGAWAVLLASRPAGTARLGPTEIAPISGNAYSGTINIDLPLPYSLAADTNSGPTASLLEVLENGVPLGPAHSRHDEIISRGEGRFSHWGDGRLHFSTSDNSDPRTNGRTYDIQYIAEIQPALRIAASVTFISIAICLAAIFLRRFPSSWLAQRKGPLAFGLACAFGALSVNFHFLLAHQSFPGIAPDTSGYIIWHPYRTIGLFLFLHLSDLILLNWNYFPVLQANLISLSLCMLGYGLARLLRNYAWGAVFVLAAFQMEETFQWSLWVLTEAPFIVALNIHLAGALLLLSRFSTPRGLLTGLGLASMLLLKSVSVVFFVPAILLLFSIRVHRMRAAVFILAPAAAAILIPSWLNYQRLGEFKPSVFGGIALVGHVGWGIDADPSSAYPDLSRRIAERLAPIIGVAPSNETVAQYVARTTGAYNQLLWRNIVPEVRAYLLSKGFGSTRYDLVLAEDAVMSTLANEAIQRHPYEYAKLAGAHYYWLSTHMFTFGSFGKMFQKVHEQPAELLDEFWRQRLDASAMSKEPGQWPDKGPEHMWPSQLRALVLAALERPLFQLLQRYGGQVTLGLSLLASCLLFWSNKIGPPLKGLCYCGLMLNAYCLGTALFQVYIARYGHVMQPVALAMWVIASAWVCAFFAASWRRVVGARYADRSSLQSGLAIS